MGSAGYLFATNLPAGAPLSQVVGRAELWFPAHNLRRCLPGLWLWLPPQEEPDGCQRPFPRLQSLRPRSSWLVAGEGPAGKNRTALMTSRAITSFLRLNSSPMCTKIFPSSLVSLHLPHLLLSRLCPFPLALPGFSQLYNSSSCGVLDSTPQTPPWNSVGRGRREWDPDTFRLAARRGTGLSLMGDRIPRDPVPPPHTSHLPPEISLKKEKAQYLSERRVGTPGLRQKCGLGGQGRRRRGGAERPESLGLEPY